MLPPRWRTWRVTLSASVVIGVRLTDCQRWSLTSGWPETLSTLRRCRRDRTSTSRRASTLKAEGWHPKGKLRIYVAFWRLMPWRYQRWYRSTFCWPFRRHRWEPFEDSLGPSEACVREGC